MKKVIVVMLVLAVCFSLSACGKSEAVIAAEDAITAIGEVSLDSGDAIANAKKLYGILTDDEKSEVENRLVLVDAEETFERMRGEVIYDNAKMSYEQLKEVSELCVKGMDAIYGGWYFGIYKADDASSSTYSFYSDMAKEVPGISSSELQAAAKKLGITSVSFVKSDWQYSLIIVETAIIERGDYKTIEENMTKAEKTLQKLTDEYNDYTYYPKLKELYSAVKSYVDFYKSPTGSFKQLADTINSYENGIRTLESDVGFLFNK